MYFFGFYDTLLVSRLVDASLLIIGIMHGAYGKHESKSTFQYGF